MTTEREKIIQLARECGLIGYYLKQDDFIEAFYHKAQAEAFEIDAKLCDRKFFELTRQYGSQMGVGAGYCAEAIREMAKESRK